MMFIAKKKKEQQNLEETTSNNSRTPAEQIQSFNSNNGTTKTKLPTIEKNLVSQEIKLKI